MRKFYILFSILAVSAASAQIVDIPDPAFKAALLAETPAIDTNGNGEIEVSEAEAVTEIVLSFVDLQNVIGIQSFTNLERFSLGSYSSIAETIDLSGMSSLKTIGFHKSSAPAVVMTGLSALESISLGYFGTIEFIDPAGAVNLDRIHFFNVGMTSLDLSPFPNLTSFIAYESDLAYVNVDGLAKLEVLEIHGAGQLSEIDLSDNVNLKSVAVHGNGLTEIDFSNNLLLESASVSGSLSQIDVSMLPNLKKLGCSGNNLTSLDLSNNVLLEELYASGNQLATIDLSMLPKLRRIFLANNLFTSLDFSGQTTPYSELEDYDVRNNPNLEYVNLKNGKTDRINPSYLECPNLVYVCVDDSDIYGQTVGFQISGTGSNVQVNTYCTFVPGGNYNTITGAMYFDNDGSGCDGSDPAYPSSKLMISSSDGNSVTYSSEEGFYDFFVEDGNYTITPQLMNPYFTVSPASAVVSFSDINNNIETQNFCIVPNGVVKDVEISLITVNTAIPGFDATYKLIYENKGNQILSGAVTMSFEDDVLDVISAVPNFDSQSVNQLQWDYSNLNPFEKRTIDVVLNLNSPQETPPLNDGDILNFTAEATPVADDHYPADNTAIVAQHVLNSLDPNDKTCLEGDVISPELIGQYVHYMIRFENTGSHAVQNIVVRDTIDTSKFLLGSLMPVHGSHPFQLRLTGTVAEFIFENINLPFDDANNDGHITFKIKTRPTLTPGQTFENTANIYFDYNFPVETNTASTMIQSLGIPDLDLKNNFTIYPNPARNVVNIAVADNVVLQSAAVYNMLGQLVASSIESPSAIDISALESGAYLIRVMTDQGASGKTFIKE